MTLIPGKLYRNTALITLPVWSLNFRQTVSQVKTGETVLCLVVYDPEVHGIVATDVFVALTGTGCIGCMLNRNDLEEVECR